MGRANSFDRSEPGRGRRGPIQAAPAGIGEALTQLADLPRIVAELQAKIETLETRLTLAERRPFTVAQASAALGVSQKTIRRRVADGSLRVVRTGSRIAIYLDEPSEDDVSAVVLGRAA